jgi:hypothetical protein
MRGGDAREARMRNLHSNMIAQKIAPFLWWIQRRCKVDLVQIAHNRGIGSRVVEVVWVEVARWGVEVVDTGNKDRVVRGDDSVAEAMVVVVVVAEEVVLEVDAKKERTAFPPSLWAPSGPWRMNSIMHSCSSCKPTLRKLRISFGRAL